jgi:hypothetical protein
MSSEPEQKEAELVARIMDYSTEKQEETWEEKQKRQARNRRKRARRKLAGKKQR